MGRSPCCAKEGLNRGAWSVIEDKILTKYISVHGEGKWRDLPQRAGLKRCGKSCRLRWLNYLRSDIKRGNISVEEEDLIIKLHKLLGNRWSLIAGRLPGRTDNEIKNYWNTNLSKKGEQAAGNHKPQDSSNKDKQSNKNKLEKKGLVKNSSSGLKAPEAIPHRVIRTRAVRCTRVIIPQNSHNHIAMVKENVSPISDHHDTTTSTSPSSSAFHDRDGSSNFMMDFDINDLLVSDILNSNFYQANELVRDNDEYAVDGDRHYISNNNITFGYDDEAMLDESTNEIQLYENWTASDQLNEAMELKTLASFFNSEEMNR